MTDDFLFRTGVADDLIATLKKLGMEVDVFSQVQADPNLTTVRKCVEVANRFQPDVIVAFGGGSPMDAAKIAWVMYEHPEVDFEDLAMRFMDIRKRIYKFPKMGIKAKLVAIPTTSGTGSEVTPFAVVTDDATGKKYPIADYELTPNMAIVDPNLVMNLPKSLTAFGGIDAVVHALEAYVSIMANEFSDGQALQALKLLKEYLPSAYKNGAKDPKAREKVHYARNAGRHRLRQCLPGRLPLHGAQDRRCVPPAARPGQCAAHQQRDPLQRQRQPHQAGGLLAVRPAQGQVPLCRGCRPSRIGWNHQG